ERRMTDFTSRREAMPNAPAGTAPSILASSIEGTSARSTSRRLSLSAQRNGGSRISRGLSASGRLRSPTTYGSAFRNETHETIGRIDKENSARERPERGRRE